MKYYIQPLETIQTASNLGHRLSRPQAIPDTEGDTTQFTFGWIKHPEREEYAACVPENLDIPIHEFIKQALNADEDNEVKQLFTAFYGVEEEEEAKRNLVKDASRIKILDLIPSTWTETTKEALEADGWFTID